MRRTGRACSKDVGALSRGQSMDGRGVQRRGVVLARPHRAKKGGRRGTGSEGSGQVAINFGARSFSRCCAGENVRRRSTDERLKRMNSTQTNHKA